MSLWNIRQVTEMTGATVNALRYYDRQGVLRPTVKETEGRRQWLYNDEAVDKLKRLILLKHIGLSIREIRAAMNDRKICSKLVMQRLEVLKKEQESLNQRIFIAQILVASDGIDPFEGEDVDNSKLKMNMINEAIRKYVKEV